MFLFNKIGLSTGNTEFSLDIHVLTVFVYENSIYSTIKYGQICMGRIQSKVVWIYYKSKIATIASSVITKQRIGGSEQELLNEKKMYSALLEKRLQRHP